jgi:hypothetical protein
MKRTLVAGLGIWILSIGFVGAQQPERPKVVYSPIVLSGQALPAPLSGTFKSFPYHSVINDADMIAFLGSMSGPHSPDGLFVAGDGAVTTVAMRGQDAPGLAPGVDIQSFDINYHRANNHGQAVFESTLVGPGIDGTGDDQSNAFANWFWSGDHLQLIAQWQAPAPGTDARFRTFERTTLNDLGHVAFSGDLVGDSITPDNNTAFWYGAPGALTLLAREGTPGPGGVTYGDMSGFDYPLLAADGQVVFMSGLQGGGRGLFAGTAGNLQLVAKTGDPVPDTQLTYDRIQGHGTPPRINKHGEVAFVSTLSDGTRAFLAGVGNDTAVVAQTGAPTPGIDGAAFDFFFDYGINDRGEVAFHAETLKDGAMGAAIFAGDPKNIELIAASGTQAPGAEAGVEFWYFHDPVINSDGQVAFFAGLNGPASRGEHDYGLFATGHSGELRLVARFGDDFEVAPGDIRRIEALSHAGVNGTHIVTFNKSSDLSMLVRFTDGSEGIFTARVLPEPSATSMLLVAAIGWLARRRHGWRISPLG